MHRRRLVKQDGRYLLLYTFDEAGEAGRDQPGSGERGTDEDAGAHSAGRLDSAQQASLNPSHQVGKRP